MVDRLEILCGPLTRKVGEKKRTESFILVRVTWTENGAKKQIIRGILAEDHHAELCHPEREMFDALCIDVDKEYSNSWELPLRIAPEEVEKRKATWEQITKTREQ